MDLSDDDAAAVEFFERNAVSTSKGGMEINVSATVLQMAQRLSDAREALRECGATITMGMDPYEELWRRTEIAHNVLACKGAVKP